MDFALPARARRAGAEAGDGRTREPRARRDVAEDAWIIGHDAEFALELAARAGSA